MKSPQEARVHRWSDEQSILFYRFVTRLLDLLTSVWSGKIRGYGVEHVPRDRGLFLVGNHTSAIDPIAVTIALRGALVHGPGKRELFKNPVATLLLRKIGIFPLHREGLDTTAVRAMVQLYRRGEIVEVYPEGGRSPSGELREFDPGFTRLLLKLEAPVVPFGIAGAREMLPMHTLIPRRHAPIVVVFGEPFTLSQQFGRNPDSQTLEKATAYVRDQVAAMRAAAQEKLRES